MSNYPIVNNSNLPNTYYGYIGNNFDIIWIDINTNNKYTNEKLPKQEHPFEEYSYSLSIDIAKKLKNIFSGCL